MATQDTRALPMVSPASDDACCAACAAERPAPSTVPTARGPRSDDRRITFAGLLVAAGMLAIAAVSAALSIDSGVGWVTLHLALAGAAGTAIASSLPFFTTALAQVPPASGTVRGSSIALVAGGALAVTVGVSVGSTWLAVGGGAAYLAGLVGTGIAAFTPLRAALGRRARLVLVAYAAALTQVVAGVGVATAMVAGWAPVVGAWAVLKPAHAWLNVFGFLSVVIAATLIHLAPTVAGTRIRRRRSATVGITALLIGPPLIAVGFASGWVAIASIGALAELIGALALATMTLGVWRDRGHWTGDRDWHRFAGLSLVVAPVWFVVAVAIAAGRVLWLGPVPSAWTMDLLAVPLILGWTVQVLIGSWTHLVPAIGPGDRATHDMQRRRLGRWGTVRIVSWNGGVAIATLGLVIGSTALTAAGGAIVAADTVLALTLLVGAIPAIGGRATRGATSTL